MQKLFVLLLFIGLHAVRGQIGIVPNDFRQHNLTEYNSSLLIPTASLSGNGVESVALWTRWQWQNVDVDPSTTFFNYTRKLGDDTAFGVSFLQHNTNRFLDRGGALNYAQSIPLGSRAKISVGANLFGFQREIDENLTPINPNVNPDVPIEENGGFILQFAPAIELGIGKFRLGFTAENLFDFNFDSNQRESRPAERFYLGLMSYDFQFTSNSYLRPTIYTKTIPNEDLQYGGNLRYTAPKFWLQGGYNSFYGPSGGFGVHLFKHLSIGALAEYAIDDVVRDNNLSFELITVYHFKALDTERKLKPKKIKKDTRRSPKERRLAEQKAREKEERLKRAREEAERLAAEKAKEAEEERLKKEAERLAELERKAAEERAKEEERIKAEEEKERYEETEAEEGVEQGYYLIVNVYSTTEYLQKFIQALEQLGLNPQYFQRKSNGLFYVYLERYDSIEAARASRDSQFNGNYKETLWIFGVLR